MEDLDDTRRVADLHVGAGQSVGHGVVVAEELHVIVDVDASPFAVPMFIGTRRQRAKSRLLFSHKDAPPRPGELLEGSLVQLRKLGDHRLFHFI
jgi:hypothetical protein